MSRIKRQLYAKCACAQNTVYIIIHCKKFRAFLIFVGGATHEIFLTMKISRSTVHTCTCTLLLSCIYMTCVTPCAQLREAVKYSFFLDSYNASDAENYTTDTGNVSTGLISTVQKYIITPDHYMFVCTPGQITAHCYSTPH